jgi:competence protein ComEA
MSSEPQSRARRVLAFILPVLALVALVLVGRRATPAAPISATPVATDTFDAGVAEVPNDAAPESIEAEAPKQAVEQLPDGGVVVDLNLASEDDLRKLPGVGPSRAKRILELRARLGRFKSVDDLARIKGFGKATLKRLRPLTKVGA